MAKKGTYFMSAPRNRLSEQLRREWRDFSLAVLFYILLVAAALVFGSVGRYDLSREATHGFALWFLLLPAYLPLWIAGAFAWCAGIRLSFAGHEALVLGALDAAQAVIVWIGVTFYTFRLRRPSIPQHARNFVRIVIFWGLFQLLCGAALGLWEHGGLAALHDCPGRPETTVTAPDRQ